MSHQKVSLIVQPGDSFFPIVEAIDSARESVNITIFRMDDPVIQHAMMEAVERGVRVRALVAANPRGWVKENRKLLKALKKKGVETKQPAADSPKARYHYKVLTVDGKLALVLTFNPTRENLHYTRDYGVVIHDAAIAAELDRLFDADWGDAEFSPAPGLPLVISPFNSREKLTELLTSATRSIHISDAKLRDHQILNLLVAKAADGVDVRILGQERYYADVFSALRFRQITRFKLHAKCIVVDEARAFLGSMNLRYEGLNKRREVGVLVDDPDVIAQLEHVFASDWEQKVRPSSTARTQALDVATVPGVEPIVSVPAGQFALLSRTDALSRYALRRGETTIGRGDDNDIVLSDASVSRAHARIEIEDGTARFTDLKSQNGSFLNGEPVDGTVAVKPGDIIGIADADEFRFVEV